MTKKLIANGFVVINSGLELNIFNAYWLVKNEILEERDFVAKNNHAFTKDLIILDFESYEIIINSNSVILTIDRKEDHYVEEALGRYLKLLKNIKNTFHIGCGINFNWVLDDLKNEEFLKISKSMFFVRDNPLYKSFESDDSEFGAYLTKVVKDSRLKLDVKPFYNHKNEGLVQFNFNFHKEIEDTIALTDLENYLSDWKFYRQESENLINTIQL